MACSRSNSLIKVWDDLYICVLSVCAFYEYTFEIEATPTPPFDVLKVMQ